MAINPADLYTGQVTAPSQDYPLGSARDVTAPGSGDGTPFVASLVNDTWGFYQALLSEATITASGTPETAVASQYLESLKAILAAEAQSSQFAIGSIQQSILDLSQFQTINGTGWVLMDGGDITGSALATLTGTTTLPDATGCFLRNAGGQAAAIGVIQQDAMQKITGVFNSPHIFYNEGTCSGAFIAGAQVGTNRADNGSNPHFQVKFDSSTSIAPNAAKTNDVETRPLNIAVNYFIKIN